MRAVSFGQPAQFGLPTVFEATNPPAVLPPPDCTFPKAIDDRLCRHCCPRGRLPAGWQYSGRPHPRAQTRWQFGLALIATNKPAKSCNCARARGTRDASGCKCAGDSAPVDRRQTTGSAVHAHAHGAAGACLAGSGKLEVRFGTAGPMIVPKFSSASPPTRLSAPPRTSPVAPEESSPPLLDYWRQAHPQCRGHLPAHFPRQWRTEFNRYCCRRGRRPAGWQYSGRPHCRAQASWKFEPGSYQSCLGCYQQAHRGL